MNVPKLQGTGYLSKVRGKWHLKLTARLNTPGGELEET